MGLLERGHVNPHQIDAAAGPEPAALEIETLLTGVVFDPAQGVGVIRIVCVETCHIPGVEAVIVEEDDAMVHLWETGQVHGLQLAVVQATDDLGVGVGLAETGEWADHAPVAYAQVGGEPVADVLLHHVLPGAGELVEIGVAGDDDAVRGGAFRHPDGDAADLEDEGAVDGVGGAGLGGIEAGEFMELQDGACEDEAAVSKASRGLSAVNGEVACLVDSVGEDGVVGEGDGVGAPIEMGGRGGVGVEPAKGQREEEEQKGAGAVHCGRANLQNRRGGATTVRIFNLRGLPVEWHVAGQSRHPARQGMFGQSDSNDYQPFGYLGRIPLYVTTLLVLGYVVLMVALALCQAGNVPDFTHTLIFDSDAVRERFQFWRFFTYPLVNGPSIWFAVEMYLLYSFGREVEKFIGRTSFGMLYASLVLLGPCLLTAASTFVPTYLQLGGSSTVNFAVFIAFCSIYPNAEIFFAFKAKWIALILIGIFSLQLLAGHAIVELAVFWMTCLGAFLFIKYLRGHIKFSFREYFRERRSRRNLRPLPKPKATLTGKPPSPRDDVIESIDPLLDKIAKHGIASLTERERDRLEQVRALLLKKPSE